MCDISFFCKNSFIIIALSLFLSACGGGNQTNNKSSAIRASGVGEPGIPARPATPTIPVNNKPVITGSPATTTLAGTRYNFTPSATDADGDKLTFSIINKPNWASFNPRTGALTGTPSIATIGTITKNINIRVSDGKTRRSLASFSIEILGSGNGSVTLNWIAPTRNTNNSALTNLAGFKIFYGTTPGVYPNSIDIKNPSISSYIVGNLPKNTYYFVITAYNSVGISSSYSTKASKIIR